MHFRFAFRTSIIAMVFSLGVACKNDPPDTLERVEQPVRDPDTDLSELPDKFRRTHLSMDSTGEAKVRAEIAEVPDGVRIKVEIDNAPPGKYSVVVHESGDCSPPADTFGAPFQFEGGKEVRDSPVAALGEVDVTEKDRDGAESWQTTRGNLRDEGDETLLGKPIVVYSVASEGLQKELVACGMIQLRR